MRFGRTESFAWLDYEVPRWDLLLSPNAFSTPVMRRAFRYEGEILETGYPRNDLLNDPDRELRAAAVRKRLGIPAGKKVVLYAPTWRDDDHVERGVRVFSMRLDVERARQRLAEDHILLVRTHYLVTDRAGAPDDDFVRDVSCYPDISELYLITDLLVTDYSSAMFDFAITGRPMVFFAYDLERYRDVTRGFYFDLEAEAPGPVVRSSEAAIEAVRAAERPAEAYGRFRQRYCHHDDGRASARVVDRLLRDL
jgi:CDP-glycerol glycerophosphotransferase